MMNKPCKELFESRKEEMKRYIASKNGIRGCEIEEVLSLGRSRANAMLLKVVRLGEIYKSGAGPTTRFWINEAHYIQHKEAEIPQRKYVKDKPANITVVVEKREPSPMKFLSRKRPAGINTVFEECKQNFGILPVLQVMAARRVA
ncbi:hypothetical protein SRABI106_01630 [Rahnella aquatilis]|nr:hypothetical protein SRABI106_01630 [Rahnella aquatilis]